MTTDSELHAAALERLSALMDGELDAAATERACARWRDDAASRADWHAYHLIGDVLRSEDLACDPGRDLAFLAAFRARLADEPVVLAPQALQHSPAVAVRADGGLRGSRWSWLAPSAMAAAFVAVAGVLMLTRAPGTPPARDASVPVAQAPQVPAVPAPSVPAVVEAQTFVASGSLIRDARLDRYLDAHKQFAGSSALGVPSGFLRSATTVNLSDR